MKAKLMKPYPLKICGICPEYIPAETKSGVPYKEYKYQELNVCHDPICNTTWRKRVSNGTATQIFNPPMDLIDYFCFGRMDEYRQLLNLEAQYSYTPGGSITKRKK